MRKYYLMLISIMSMIPALSWADVIQPVLNKVSLQMTAEKWAKTSAARVVVNVDASLDKLSLATANSEIIKKLQSIANADWHITQFARAQDKSGLEQLHVVAEARIAESGLAGLRDRAKAVSKPGETYSIDTIDFSPSTAEIEQTIAEVRAQIYASAKQEIARLNQVYPDEHFFLYSIDFTPQNFAGPGPLAKITTMGMPAEGQGLSVNAKITQTATVVVASPAPSGVKLNVI